ncbi:hypothetical protein J6590_057444 [Homalodisca vitripennis]|nr:hypothetical protein J6590_057444 [Homalodisca vitripennis]
MLKKTRKRNWHRSPPQRILRHEVKVSHTDQVQESARGLPMLTEGRFWDPFQPRGDLLERKNDALTNLGSASYMTEPQPLCGISRVNPLGLSRSRFTQNMREVTAATRSGNEQNSPTVTIPRGGV